MINPINYNINKINSSYIAYNKISFKGTINQNPKLPILKQDTFESKSSDFKREKLINHPVICTLINNKSMDKSTICEFSNLDDDTFNLLFKFLDNKTFSAQLSKKGLDSVLWLERIKSLIYKPDENYDLLLHFLNNDIIADQVDKNNIFFAYLTDDAKKYGAPYIENFDILFNKNNIKRAIDTNQTDVNTLFEITRYEDYKFDKFINITDGDADFQDAYDIVNTPYKYDLYDRYKEKYSPKNAAVMANIYNIEYYDTDNINDIIEALEVNKKDDERISEVFNRFLYKVSHESKNIEGKKKTIDNIANYIKYLNLNQLKAQYPVLNDYSFENLLTFLEYNANNTNKTEFNKNDLTYKGDVTELVKHNYLSEDSMNDLLSVYPLTNRQIGELPKRWLNNSSNHKITTEEIYESISKFQKTKNIKSFAKELTSILKQKVKVTELKSGGFGTCYRIKTKNEDICLKIFKDNRKIYTEDTYNNGANVEPQTAAFMSNNFKYIVPFYFGRISGSMYKDGFYATKYLDESNNTNNYKNISILQSQTNNNFKYYASDLMRPGNVINGLITDFGQIKIRDENNRKVDWSVK